MPDYRRNRIEGGTYFFTVALADRRSDLLVREVAALRASATRARALHPFTIDAWTVLPDHLHAVWTLPEGDADFSTRWTLIKRGFSSRLAKGESRSASRVAKAERRIWQRRFWEHTIRNKADFVRHVDYVHFNPVKHGFVSNACDWPYSSFGRAVARGDYPADWGGRRGGCGGVWRESGGMMP
jgi:putative transposase